MALGSWYASVAFALGSLMTGFTLILERFAVYIYDFYGLHNKIGTYPLVPLSFPLPSLIEAKNVIPSRLGRSNVRQV